MQRMVAAIERSLERRAEQKKHVIGTLLLPGSEHLANAVRHFHADIGSLRDDEVSREKLSDVHQQLLNIWRVVSDTPAQRGLKARRERAFAQERDPGLARRYAL